MFVICAVPLPEVRINDAEDRLRHLAGLAERMMVALTVVVGIWYRDPTLGADLESILAHLEGCPEWMMEWQFSGAFEGARMALALVRAHYPSVNLHELVRSTPERREPPMFFDEVRVDAKFVAGACDLDNIIEQGE